MSDRRFVCGPRMELQGANGYHNETVAGVVAPTALAGLAHRIDMELRRHGSPMRSMGAGIVVHSWDLREGLALRVPTDPTKTSAPIVPEIVVDATIGIFLEVGHEDGFEPDDDSDMDAFETIAPILQTGRLGGGRIFPPWEAEFGPETLARLTEKEAIAALSRGGGHLLVDSHRDLARFAAGRRIDEAIAEAIRRVGSYVDGSWSESDVNVPEGGGRYVPIAVGYAPIESFRSDRIARIAGAPHAYATSLSSLGRYVPVRDLVAQETGALAGSVWRYETKGLSEAYVATTHP